MTPCPYDSANIIPGHSQQKKIPQGTVCTFPQGLFSYKPRCTFFLLAMPTAVREQVFILRSSWTGVRFVLCKILLFIILVFTDFGVTSNISYVLPKSVSPCCELVQGRSRKCAGPFPHLITSCACIWGLVKHRSDFNTGRLTLIRNGPRNHWRWFGRDTGGAGRTYHQTDMWGPGHRLLQNTYTYTIRIHFLCSAELYSSKCTAMTTSEQ